MAMKAKARIAMNLLEVMIWLAWMRSLSVLFSVYEMLALVRFRWADPALKFFRSELNACQRRISQITGRN